MEKLLIQLQKLIDNLRERPWVVFLSLSIMWGTSGWTYFLNEQREHKKDVRGGMLGYKEATDKTIEAQAQALQAKDKLIETLTQQRIETEKNEDADTIDKHGLSRDRRAHTGQ